MIRTTVRHMRLRILLLVLCVLFFHLLYTAVVYPLSKNRISEIFDINDIGRFLEYFDKQDAAGDSDYDKVSLITWGAATPKMGPPAHQCPKTH